MSKGLGLGDLVKQAQELQERLSQMQEAAGARTIEASAGGGMVTATVTGRMELTALRIDPEVVRSGDVAMLQDLVIAAVNQALRSAQAMVADEMRKATGGLKIPGLGG
jgi:hypothetical protein